MSLVFGRKLRQAMVEAEVNQTELARLTGLPKSSISQYLSGRNEPGILAGAKLAEVLGPGDWSPPEPQDIPEASDNAPERPFVLKPCDAAKVLGTNPQSIRVRMQNGSFSPSIGTIYRAEGTRFTYDIYPGKLAAFLDISVDEVFRRLSA
jgi:DNA-binding XRE family transcriptional regulator